MKLYSVLVTYNRAALLERTLEHLAAGGFERVIVVDNCSTDGTAAVLESFRSRIPELHVRTLPANRGGAGGFEAGVEEFLRLSRDPHDHALLHDDDSWPNFSAAALSEAVDPAVRLGCFPVLHPDGDLARMNVPGRAAFLRSLRSAREYFSGRRPGTVDEFRNFDGFDYCSFVGFLARRDVLAALGAPSAEFFIYSDDTTYTYLASRRFGPIRNLHATGLTFTHDCRRSTGRNLLLGLHHHFEVRNKIILFRLCATHPALLTFFFVARSIAGAPQRALTTLRAAVAAYRADKDAFLPRGLRAAPAKVENLAASATEPAETAQLRTGS